MTDYIIIGIITAVVLLLVVVPIQRMSKDSQNQNSGSQGFEAGAQGLDFGEKDIK